MDGVACLGLVGRVGVGGLVCEVLLIGRLGWLLLACCSDLIGWVDSLGGGLAGMARSVMYVVVWVGWVLFGWFGWVG